MNSLIDFNHKALLGKCSSVKCQGQEAERGGRSAGREVGESRTDPSNWEEKKKQKQKRQANFIFAGNV